MAEVTEIIGKKTTASSYDVAGYDFKHPKLVSKEIIRALRNIHEHLSRNLSRIFSTSLSLKIDVELKGIEQTVFSEYLQNLASPGTYYIFQIEEFGEWAIMEVDPAFCIYAIERQGGSKESSLDLIRTMSRIEERIFSRTVEKIFDEIKSIWEPHIAMTIGHYVYENKPENIHSVSPVEPAVIADYEITVNQESVPFKICYPYAILKEAIGDSFHKFGSRIKNKNATPEEREQYHKELKSVPVSLKAVLGRTHITVYEMLQLQRGDAIKLKQLTYEPIEILLNHSKKMKAFPGTINSKRAVKIFEVFEQEKSDKE